ncbi:hypothetical protein BCR34DRAFT_605138 [Clohesyomyces aquaticus]|uniref:Uncharacterized protein n=1 Tax=Clohesyomyces aquaticus TaxID=1231657 RepID=A0A1Y1Z1E4_9PLEO|nr:hypothetical protein BCR34DRAFT_605138 [Clohesyomyces aquaticus]
MSTRMVTPTEKQARYVTGGFSDMFAFFHILSGTGCSQTWMSSGDAQELVQKYEKFLHGNPNYDRKVVLDKSKVDIGVFSSMKIIPYHVLHQTFLDTVKAES